MSILISSLPGIHQNSNVTTGGGTDDTAVIQAALTAGPFPLVLIQDGASLVTGLNIGSNTTLQCDNSTTHGFYLANSSNRALLRNLNRSGTVTNSNTNITIDSGVYNGNIANQTYDANHLETDGTPMSIIQLYGISNVEIKNVVTKNQVYAGVGFGTCNNVNIHDCTSTAADNTTLNVTCFDCRGPATNVILKTLTCLVGDDAIALNGRNYAGSPNIGPYVLGGTITNVVIDTINFQNCWAGIDILPDAAHSITVNDVYMQNLTGSVQNYAVYLNRDLFNTPPATGVCTNIYVAGTNTVTLSGSPAPFGGLIPAGLWLIDVTCNTLQMSGFNSIFPQTVKFPTSAGNTTALMLQGVNRGAQTGAVSVITGYPVILQKGALTPAGAGTTAAKAFPSNVTAGTSLVVFTFAFTAGGTTITNIVDTRGNSYLGNEIAAFSDGATGHVAKLYRVTNVGSGANTVTVTFGQTTAICGLLVAEYLASTLDQVSSLLLDAAETTVNCPSVTTTKTFENVLGVGITEATSGCTGAGGYTAELNGASVTYVCLVDKLAATAGANAPSWTQASFASYRSTMSLAGVAVTAWTISGNAGVAGTTITYSGTASGTVTADSTGNYQITSLAAGAYTITPSKTLNTFSPTSLSPTIGATDITGQVFTGTALASGNAGSLSLRRRKRRDVIS